MAIKKRPPVDPELEARIESFGAAADQTAPQPAPEKAPSTAKAPARPAAAVPRRKAPSKRAPGEKPEQKPMLIRFDSEEHQLLREVAELEGRSMHNMAKMALIPALEAIKETYRS